MEVTDNILANADLLALALETRLHLHIDERVEVSRQDHWTLRFTLDNIPPMAVAMCLAGHIGDEIQLYRIDERLLALPMNRSFAIISGVLAN